MGDILWDELQWKKSLQRDTVGQQCLKLFLITTNAAKCARHLQINPQ